MANILPLTVSSKTADITLADSPIRVNPFANAGITAADAPVLLSLGSKGTVDADGFAARMVKAVGQGTKAEARLFINSLASVMGDLVDEYGAITVNTPFGTVQTFVAGTLANPQDQPDPAVNYPFLGVVIPEAYRRLFAKIETYVPADACPVSLKRVRDKSTHKGGIYGMNPFYLEGNEMSIGGAGETLELLDLATRDKLCDITVDAESTSPVQLLCQLAAQTAIEAGTYLVRLTTLAGGEPGGPLWPVELKVTLVEAVPGPPEALWTSPDGLTKVTKLYDARGEECQVATDKEPVYMEGVGLDRLDTMFMFFGTTRAKGSYFASPEVVESGTKLQLSLDAAKSAPGGTYEGSLYLQLDGDESSGGLVPLTLEVKS